MLVLIILALLLWSLVGDLCFFAIMTNIRDSELNSVEAFKYVYKTNMDRFVQYATRVWNVDMNFNNPEATVLEGIKRTEEFFTSIDMPTRLSQADIDGEKFEEMAAKATENGTLGSFVKLTKEDIVNIYRLAE